MDEREEVISVNPQNIQEIKESFDPSRFINYAFNSTILDPQILDFFLTIFQIPFHQQYFLTNVTEVIQYLSNWKHLSFDISFIQDHISHFFTFFDILFRNHILEVLVLDIFNSFCDTIFNIDNGIILHPECFTLLYDTSIFLYEQNKGLMLNYIKHCYTIIDDELLKNGYSYLMLIFYSDIGIVEPNIIRNSFCFTNDFSIHDIIYQNIEIFQMNLDIFQEIIECFIEEIINNQKLTYHMRKIMYYLESTKDLSFIIAMCTELIHNRTKIKNPGNAVSFFNAFFAKVPIVLYSALSVYDIRSLFQFYTSDFVNIFQLQAFLTSIVEIDTKTEIWLKLKEASDELATKVLEYCDNNEPFFIFFKDFMNEHMEE